MHGLILVDLEQYHAILKNKHPRLSCGGLDLGPSFRCRGRQRRERWSVFRGVASVISISGFLFGFGLSSEFEPLAGDRKDGERSEGPGLVQAVYGLVWSNPSLGLVLD
ncbi:hypothetical protein K1719_004752 [Acacia pycnantha]|nr:hypothetical protein K1719_004752 [Acacia pycnantha]